MEKKTVTTALNSFFNTGEGKRTATAFLAELKELSTEEKRELAEAACEASGWTLA